MTWGLRLSGVGLLLALSGCGGSASEVHTGSAETTPGGGASNDGVPVGSGELRGGDRRRDQWRCTLRRRNQRWGGDGRLRSHATELATNSAQLERDDSR